MHRVLTCLTTQHDWRFVVLAAVVCVTGLATAIILMRMALGASARDRKLYALAAAGVGGLSIWATHFLAMLGYEAGVPVRYEIGLTLASLAIAVLGLTACVAILLRDDRWWTRALASACAASSVAAMHFTGTAALSLDGARIVWDPGLVAGSIIVSMLLAACAAIPARTSAVWRLPFITGMATASICALHFGAMSAMTLVADPTVVGVGLTELRFRNGDRTPSCSTSTRTVLWER